MYLPETTKTIFLYLALGTSGGAPTRQQRNFTNRIEQMTPIAVANVKLRRVVIPEVSVSKGKKNVYILSFLAIHGALVSNDKCDRIA